jgi:thiol-disulfide isomerase/thioredoxin
MKKIFSILAALTMLACGQKSHGDYVSLKGTIANTDINTLTILGKGFKKEIKVNENGTFSDTLKITDGFHGFNDGSQQSILYLKNGYDLELNFDAANFSESIEITGEGAITNNYLREKLQLIKEEQLNNYALIFELEKPDFDNRMEDLKKRMDGLLNNYAGLEKEVYDMEIAANDKLIDFYQSNYDTEHQNYVTLKKGAPSPNFNYPDHKGNVVSLEDLKGKYVYIDIWATWCAPCIREIPYLKEIQTAYQNKDIDFISLSIDKLEQKDKWLKMIEDQQLEGIQLLADNEWNSDFLTAYNITGIPRFILLDKNGNVVDADAPSPSNPKLKELFNSLEL